MPKLFLDTTNKWLEEIRFAFPVNYSFTFEIEKNPYKINTPPPLHQI